MGKLHIKIILNFAFSGEQSLMSALLSDAGKYSYCAVCVIAMKELYDNVWDKPFNEHCLDVILNHLKLPKSVSCCMDNYQSMLF